MKLTPSDWGNLRILVKSYYEESGREFEFSADHMLGTIKARIRDGEFFYYNDAGFISGRLVETYYNIGHNVLLIDYFYVSPPHRSIAVMRDLLKAAEIYVNAINRRRKVVHGITVGFGMYKGKKILKQAMAMRRFGYTLSDVSVTKEL